MAEISAAAVKTLREQTGLPMMECKKALAESGGDPQAAVEWLRKKGKKTMAGRAERATAFGRIGLYADFAAGPGGMVELLCESAPVAANEEFVRLADDLARTYATTSVATADELLARPSPSAAGRTLREQFDDLNNRIREVFRVGRMARVDGQAAGYVHHDGGKGTLLAVEGGSLELAKDVCMHIVASRPEVVAREEVDPQEVAKEREILMEQTRQEGKPENVLAKIVEGRLKDFYAQRCLLEQVFVKDSKQTVGKVVQAGGMNVKRFIRWDLGKE